MAHDNSKSVSSGEMCIRTMKNVQGCGQGKVMGPGHDIVDVKGSVAGEASSLLDVSAASWTFSRDVCEWRRAPQVLSWFEHKTRKGLTLHRVDCRMTRNTISQLVNIQLKIVIERACVSDLEMRVEVEL